MVKEKGHYVLYSLDTIRGILLTTKVLHINDYPTDWHIDEVFPGFSVILRGEESIDEILNYIEFEYYTFKPGEKEWYKKEIESYLNQGIEDLILQRPLEFLMDTNEILDQADIEHYAKSANLSVEEFSLKMQEGKKNNTKYVKFANMSTLSVTPFNRDEAIKSLNGELFGLKKWEYIQNQLAKGESRQ